MAGSVDPKGRRRRSSDAKGSAADRKPPKIDDLLSFVVEAQASDLHISPGVPPTARIDGELVVMPDARILTPDMTATLVTGMMNDEQREAFERDLEIDFSFGRRGLGRYRVSAFHERGNASAALRRIPYEPPHLEDLGLPQAVGSFAGLKQGLVLVTGPSGSGKTTTLMAIIDKINTEHTAHIITIEDPIEFVHEHKRSIVQQREVGVDTHAFAPALRAALREDPDVLLIGEMRDPETISATVSAAETGHLVFATLHTNSAAQSIDRIIDAFPPHQQQQIRLQLASSLHAVVAQRLVPLIEGGRVCVAEVLIANGAVRNLVREGKTHQLETVMQSGLRDGMTIFDARLAELVRQRRVSREVARMHCMDSKSFDSRLATSVGY
ncbi:MAG: type IV pilus twitching motility protein PilT [Coriobacteriia bacterium]|nr:type IV pilus twitching motility protein PilT [Coriobacteriia bacterium]